MKKLLLCVWVFLSIGVCMAEAKPKIAILATGGTIAGSIDSAVATTGYTAGVRCRCFNQSSATNSRFG